MSAEKMSVVRPSGRLDAAGAGPLEIELQRQFNLGRKRLIVDLHDARYISSNGLRVLLGAQKTARQSGGDLKLCCLSARVREIFEMAGLDQVFDIFPSVSEAERAFATMS